MNRVLLGAALAAAAFVLVSFTLREPAGVNPALTQAVTPLKLCDLTLDRAFRWTVSVPLPPQNVTFVMPATGGFVITSIYSGSVGLFGVQISVNGGPPETLRVGDGNYHYPRELGAPLVLR